MIHPDTRILAQGIGYVRIGTILEPFPVWAGDRVETTNITVREPVLAVKVKLINGIEVVCSHDQLFRARYRRGKGNQEIPARKLNGQHLVYLGQSTFEFDYLDLQCYNYLGKLSSYELGVLMGMVKTLGTILDFPKMRKEARAELKRLLEKMGVDFEVREYRAKRTDRFTYIVKGQEFEEELLDFGLLFTRNYWKSKKFLEGYLKSLFTFCQIGNETFTIKSGKDTDFLKDVQQALLLFGVNSSYTKGLRLSQLSIFKNNCYRFANNIGIFNPEILFEGVDFSRFVDYKDRTTSDMRYARVGGVEHIGFERLVELDVSCVANGVILEKL